MLLTHEGYDTLETNKHLDVNKKLNIEATSERSIWSPKQNIEPTSEQHLDEVMETVHGEHRYSPVGHLGES